MEKQYGIQEVFDLIGEDNLNITYVGNSSRDSIEVDGFKVYTKSLRYATFFQKGTKCVCCGREGAYFQLDADKSGGNTTTRRHFNLYAADGVLMTKDHIKPVKLGGADTIDNMQTMCKECNENKGSIYEVPVDSIVCRPVDSETEKMFLSLADAVSYVCELKRIYNTKPKPSKLARRVVEITLELQEAIKTGSPYVGRYWSQENRIWKGCSYVGHQ